MELEALDKKHLTNNRFTADYIISAINEKKEYFILKFTNNPDGKSITDRIIILENQMMIMLNVEISYRQLGDDYAVKTKEIKKLSLYDTLGHKITLEKEDEQSLKSVITNLIIADIQ